MRLTAVHARVVAPAGIWLGGGACHYTGPHVHLNTHKHASDVNLCSTATRMVASTEVHTRCHAAYSTHSTTSIVTEVISSTSARTYDDSIAADDTMQSSSGSSTTVRSPLSDAGTVSGRHDGEHGDETSTLSGNEHGDETSTLSGNDGSMVNAGADLPSPDSPGLIGAPPVTPTSSPTGTLSRQARATARKLTSTIKQCTTWSELSDVYLTHRTDMDFIHISAVLTLLPKLRLPQMGKPAGEGGDRLEGVGGDRLEQLSGQDAEVQEFSSMFSQLIQDLVSVRWQLRARELANVMWASSQLGTYLTPHHHVWELLLEAASPKLGELNEQEMSSVMLALGAVFKEELAARTVDTQPGDGSGAASDPGSESTSWSGQEVRNSSGSGRGTAHVGEESLPRGSTSHMDDALGDRQGSMEAPSTSSMDAQSSRHLPPQLHSRQGSSPMHLSHPPAALSQRGGRDVLDADSEENSWLTRLHSFADALLLYCQPLVPLMGPQALSNTLWAVPHLHPRPPQQLLHTLLSASEAQMYNFTSQGLSIVATSFVRLKYRPGRRWRYKLLDASWILMPQDMGAHALSSLLWALISLGQIPPEPWLARCLDTVQRLLDAGLMNSRDTASVLWALATVWVRPPIHLLAPALALLYQRSTELQPQGLSMVLWALAAMGVRPSETWVQRMLRAAAARAAEFDVQGADTLLCALHTLGMKPNKKFVARLTEHLQEEELPGWSRLGASSVKGQME